jgi:tetratricopeptide (TPR) repeat protein
MDMIQRALKSKPDSGYIIDSLGWVYYQKGLYDEALKYLLEAAKLVPNDPTISEHLGDVYFKKRIYGSALEEYEKALNLNHPQADKVKEKILQLKKLLKQNHPESKRSFKAL